jgi:signal peptide peptidase SppA
MASKYRSIIRAVYGAEWCILPEKLEQIRELLEMRSQGLTLSKEEAAAHIAHRTQQFGSQPPSQVAVLNMYGTISQRMNMMSEFSGGTSTELFQKAFIEARDNPDVKAIVINADTPGGSVPGVPELAELIYSSRDAKQIITVVNPMMASAGVWIGTAAGEVVAIPSASDIGSIGVMAMHTEHSAADVKDGLKTTIITSNEFKAERNPFEPLSEAAIENAQSRVMSIHHEFVDAVAKHRGVASTKVESDFGNGRTMLAKEALAVGLIDRIATLEQVLTELGTVAGSGSRVSVAMSPHKITTKADKMNAAIKLQLIKEGVCKATDEESAFVAALGLHCEAKGIDATDEAKVLASFGTATAPPVTTTTAGTTEVIQPPAAPHMSHSELLATVKVSGLDSDTQLDLVTSITPLLSTISLQGVLDKISTAKLEAAGPAVGAVAPNVTADSHDKFKLAAREAILERSWGPGDKPEQVFDYASGEMQDYKPKKAQPGLMSLPKLAERCLIESGIPHQQVSNLSGMQVAQIMMDRSGDKLNQLGMVASSDGAGYNVSGMFSNILLDASNVMLRRSYDEAPASYTQWMRQGPSVADFKTVNKVIAGELGDPKAVPEDGEFEEETLTDSKETYKLTVWGSIFSHSWQLVVNDALNSFTEIPLKLGRSMRRKQNRLAYAVLKDNATMGDTGALFNTTAITTAGGHDNITTGTLTTVANYVTGLNTMAQQMAEQKGLDITNGAALNLTPNWIIFPPALRGIIMQTLNSTSSDATNPGLTNIWQNGLVPIQDAELGGASTGGSDLQWYTAANSADVDTVEYAFLQGLEAPMIEQETSFTSLAMKQRIYQAFAVSAIDHRGMQRHNGA